MNPYEILELPRNATKSTIRARYKELAMANHPDKLHDLSPEEKAKKEEYFKNVTVAYQILLDHKARADIADTTDTIYNTEYWRDLWNKFSRQNVWDTFVDVATKYIKRKIHRVTLPVTLEEVWNKTAKKVQFFLKAVQEPIRVLVDCGKYPYTELEYESADGNYHNIQISMKYKEHDIYSIDDDGILYACVYIDIHDYISGVTIDLPFLDGTEVHIPIPPFQDLAEELVIDEYKLRVQVGLNGIDKCKWDALSRREQCIFEEIIIKLKQTHVNGAE